MESLALLLVLFIGLFVGMVIGGVAVGRQLKGELKYWKGIATDYMNAEMDEINKERRKEEVHEAFEEYKKK